MKRGPKNYYITPLVKMSAGYHQDVTYGPMDLELPEGVDTLFYSDFAQAAWTSRGAWSYRAKVPGRPEVVFVLSKSPEEGLDWIASLEAGSVIVREV